MIANILKEKTALKTKKSLIKFKNAVRGARRPRLAVREARRELLPGAFTDAVTWLRGSLFDVPFSLKTPFRSGFRDLELEPSYLELEFELELSWAAYVIAQFPTELRAFNSTALDFSRAVLLGDAEHAFGCLDSIETSFGPSIWLIKNRLAAEQRFRGFEAQKRFLLLLKDSAEAGGLVPFVAHYVSIRNEASISPRPFKALYRRHREAQSELPPDLSAHAAFHIMGELPDSESECSVLLNLESDCCLIDYFQCFKTLISHYAHKRMSKLPQRLAKAVQECARAINDVNFLTFLYCSTSDTTLLEQLNLTAVSAFDEFLAGNYEGAAMIGATWLGQDPNAVEVLELVARARSATATPRLQSSERRRPLDDILDWMQSVIAKDADSKQSLLQLEKIALNFHSLPWAAALSSFCTNELRATPELEALHFKARSNLPSGYIHPFHAVTFSREVQVGYLDVCKTLYGDTLTINVVQAFITQDAQIAAQFSKVERSLLQAEWAMMGDDWSTALDAARELLNEPLAYFQHKAVRLYAYCLLRLGRVEEAITYITTVYVAEPRLFLILPIASLAPLVTDQNRYDLRSDPSLAIFYDIYSRHIDDKNDHLRQYAFEDLISASGVSRPHKLASRVPHLDKAKLLYFLRFLCIPHIMDVSPEFESSNDLLDERLSVCQVLAEMDPAHILDYQSEIKDITRRLVVQSGIHHIEQTKIYVDIASIRQFVMQNMSETFTRYKTFASLETTNSSIILRLREDKGSKSSSAIVTLHLPTNEKFDILRSLVYDIRDHFVSSSEHGLDGYLSVRIRHGTLSGQLRSGLEAAHLLTQRDRKLSTYRPNHYWGARVLAPDEDTRAYVANRLAAFSDSFDSLVEELLSQWIQVRKPGNDHGMFDFDISDFEVRQLLFQITAETTFDHFLDLVITHLWQRLALNLDYIRERLSEEAKPRFDQLLGTLQFDIEALEGDADVSDLSNAIATARTEMQRLIRRVIEWFRLPAQTTGSPFRLDLPVQIAVESVRRFYPRVVLDPEIQPQAEIDFGPARLAPLVDIFFILFENVAKHAGSIPRPRVDVSLAIEGNGVISISVRNSIAPHVKTKAVTKNVKSIQEAIDRGTYHAAVNSEGGTGLVKIHKTLTHDFGRRSRVQFGFTGDGAAFEVHLEIPMEARS